MDDSRCELITGGLHVDERGAVAFVNDFSMDPVRRFYVLRSGADLRPRGWIGHRREHKWFFVTQGSVLIAVVEPDDWERPSSSLAVERSLLDATRPAVLHVPPGHANAIVPQTADATLVVFSSVSLDDSRGDDYRFALSTWPAR